MASASAPPICARIREARERAELSQEKMAAKLGLTLNGYAPYERFREPNYTRRKQIARVLGLDENYFEPTPNDDLDERLAQVERQLEQVVAVRDQLDRIEAALALLSEPPQDGQAQSAN